MNPRKALQGARTDLLLRWLLPLLVFSACTGGTSGQRESPREQELPEVQPTDEILNIWRGEKDSQNRFDSTVFVTLSPEEECSGVLVHPRLVLTAAHCVCRGRESKDGAMIDGSTCVKTATVNTGNSSATFKSHTGEVRSHRDFRVVLRKKKLQVPPDAQAEHIISEGGKRYILVDVVVASRADLAVIELNQAVEGRFSPPSLAQTDIKLNEQVVMAGYGADDVKSGLVAFTSKGPIRRFGGNIVAKTNGETFTVESPGALPLPGDSGGPCFREEAARLVLVGINSRATPGRRAVFTSTYRYMDWLAEELKRADKNSSTAP